MVDGTRIKRPSIMDMKTTIINRPYVVLHAGDHKKRGIVLNFCPFCGTSLKRTSPETAVTESKEDMGNV